MRRLRNPVKRHSLCLWRPLAARLALAKAPARPRRKKTLSAALQGKLQLKVQVRPSLWEAMSASKSSCRIVKQRGRRCKAPQGTWHNALQAAGPAESLALAYTHIGPLTFCCAGCSGRESDTKEMLPGIISMGARNDSKVADGRM